MKSIEIIKEIKKVKINNILYIVCSASVMGNLLFILKYKTTCITNYIYSKEWENDFIGKEVCKNYSDYNWNILSQEC